MNFNLAAKITASAKVKVVVSMEALFSVERKFCDSLYLRGTQITSLPDVLKEKVIK